MKISTTSHRLREIMRSRDLKQIDILNMSAKYCSEYNVKLNKSDLSQFVNGKVEPGSFKLSVLSKALGVSETCLMGYDVPMEREYIAKEPSLKHEFDIYSLPNVFPVQLKKFPLLGKIAW